MGDCNNCKPGKSLCNFYQYVTCPTQLAEFLDLCYGSIKGAYKSFSRAPLGMFDHNTVYLVPSYKLTLKARRPELRLVPVWLDETIWGLQNTAVPTGTFSKTIGRDLDEQTEMASAYITFCELFPFLNTQTTSHGSPNLSNTVLTRGILLSFKGIWTSIENCRNKLKRNWNLMHDEVGQCTPGMGEWKIHDMHIVQKKSFIFDMSLKVCVKH